VLAADILGEFALVAELENLTGMVAVEVELPVYNIVSYTVLVKGLEDTPGYLQNLCHTTTPCTIFPSETYKSDA